jgi:uncharacterized protein (TIGR02271 family)
MATERSTVVGVFRDRDLADRAIDELHRLGFSDDEIGFAVRDGDSTIGVDNEPGDAGSGAVTGAIAGAGVGGFIGAAVALLIPGFGPVVAGGILASILGGAVVGAAAGGILGALVGLGVPEEEARYYENEFNAGNIIVTVKAGTRYDEARQILFRNGAYDVTDREGLAPAGMATGTTGRGLSPDEMHNTVPGEARGLRRDPEHDRMELREERVRPRTESAETGEVTVGKEVVTEHREMEVPIRREEVTIERRPVEGRPASGEIRDGEEIRVPVYEEQVTVDKEAVVYEEVEVHKTPVQNTERISTEIRREEPRLEHTSGVTVRGWEEVVPEFRQSWQTRYGSQGARWEDFEPAYRYGYEMSSDPRFTGREWMDVESEMRTGYGTWSQGRGFEHDVNAWERHRDAVREGWERIRNQRRAA